jgi:hypothetical protein
MLRLTPISARPNSMNYFGGVCANFRGFLPVESQFTHRIFAEEWTLAHFSVSRFPPELPRFFAGNHSFDLGTRSLKTPY